MLDFFGKIWTKLAIAGAILLGLLVTVLKIKANDEKEGREKAEAADAVAAKANDAAKQSADVANDTAQNINTELSDAQKQTGADSVAVRDAGSLRDGADAVNAAINRANGGV